MASPSIRPASLERHLDKLEVILRRETLGHSTVSLLREYLDGGLIAGLMRNEATESVERNLGRDASVAPVFELGGDGLLAWLGLRTEWRPAPNGHLSFHDISMTIHFGYPYRQPKPQVFRMEWSVQPEDTGQPHWQFDALESVATEPADSDVFRHVLESEAVDGDAGWLDPEDIVTVVRGMNLSRLHFASAAAWWHGNSVHVNTPRSTKDIESWVDRTLTYTKSELGRLRRS